MAPGAEDLDRLLASLPTKTKRQQGDAFERVCQWLILRRVFPFTDVETVWLWPDWRWAWDSDEGIDLVAVTQGGEWWAIQAKSYHPTSTVTKRQLDSFDNAARQRFGPDHSLRFAQRVVIATTDRYARRAQRYLEGPDHPAIFLGRTRLEAMPVEWPATYGRVLTALGGAALEPTLPPRRELRPHQEDAVDAAAARLHTSRRVQVRMATGTGKTLVAEALAERLDARRVLVCVPSLALVRQTLEEWLGQRRRPWLVVCSDEDAAPGGAHCEAGVLGADAEDEPIDSIVELGCPVTTRPDEIAAALGTDGELLVVVTYQSTPRVAAAQALLARPVDGAAAAPDYPLVDLIVCDEAHRTAGGSGGAYATVLDDHQIAASHRVFFTATPKLYSPAAKQRADDRGLPLISMDDEQVYGPVAHTLPVRVAITDGLLSDYRVVFILSDDADVSAAVRDRTWVRLAEPALADVGPVDAERLGTAVAVMDAILRHDLRRTISFHSRISSARRFARLLEIVRPWWEEHRRIDPSVLGRWRLDHVSGEMPMRKRHAALGRLRNLPGVDRALVTNSRCLGEGIDVPSLDGIVFADPKHSVIATVQAVGRAIRYVPGKTATIVVPAVLDRSQLPAGEMTPEDVMRALRGNGFATLVQVLSALKAHDDVLAEELTGLNLARGRRGGGAGGRIGVLDVVLPSDVGNEFVDALSLAVLDRIAPNWEFWYGLLERYRDAHGHIDMPVNHREGVWQLGKWVDNRRTDHKKEILSPEWTKRLGDLKGWKWSPHEEAWEEGFSALQAFIAEFGHADVGQRHITAEGFRLGQWVNVQRTTLGPAVPESERDRQRHARLAGVTEWRWSPSDDDFAAMLAAVASFADAHGHVEVPVATSPSEKDPGRWVVRQRALHQQERLPAARVAALEAVVGWTWYEPDERVALITEALARHYASGNKSLPRPARVMDYLPETEPISAARGPLEGVAHEGLAVWLTRTRFAADRGAVTPAQARALAVVPEVHRGGRSGAVGYHLTALAAYAAAHGNTEVPLAYRTDNDRALGTWVAEVRGRIRRDDVDPVLHAELRAIPGWDDDPWETTWERQRLAFAQYAAREQSGDVPTSWEEEIVIEGTTYRLALGRWVQHQRQKPPTGEQGVRLADTPGWTWDANQDRWDRNLSALVAFYEQQGRYPKQAEHDPATDLLLGKWVNQQRIRHKAGKLEPARAARLEAWEPWRWTG